MNLSERALLSVLGCTLHGGVPDDPGLSGDNWAQLLTLAREQELLPLIYDAVCHLQSFCLLDSRRRADFQQAALEGVTREVMQRNDFLNLLCHAQAQGLDPVVLKGIVLRSLYPRPMLRPSVDEDLLIPPGEAEAYDRFFLGEGLQPDDPEATERSYHRPDSPTYIELHTSPFPPDVTAYGDCSALFDGAIDRAVRVEIDGVSVRTLAPTDHLLFLLCHAYKHFLHGGIGIRQVCDMAVLADRFDSEIDWAHVRRDCESIRIAYFAAALFRIAEKRLGFAMPEVFASLEADEEPLLADILSGGNLGTADIDRMHSGNLTLNAVAAQKQGRRRSGLWASVFPSVEYMEGRYPWLRGRRWLLPAAWLRRAGEYLLSRDTNAAASLRLGRDRIEILKQYRIID